MENISRDDMRKKYEGTYFQIKLLKDGSIPKKVFKYSDSDYAENGLLSVVLYEWHKGKAINAVRFTIDEIDIIPMPDSKLIEFEGNVFHYTKNGHRQWKAGYCHNSCKISCPLTLYLQPFHKIVTNADSQYKLLKELGAFSRDWYGLGAIIEGVFLTDKIVRPLTEAIERLGNKTLSAILYETFWISLSPTTNDEYFIFSLHNLIATVKGKKIKLINQKYRQEVLDYLKRSNTQDFTVE